MPDLDALTTRMRGSAIPVGGLVTRASQQVATSQSVPANPGSTGDVPTAGPQGTEQPGGIAAGFEALLALEQKLSAPIAAIPFPGFAALRVTDQNIGLPHAHSHPPNLVPPNPVPVPLPSTGPVIAIPFMSGSQRTFMDGSPAARCGDMGMGMFCGGFFPMFEVFLGSASVWTEGARQARMQVDVTKHCIFSTPRPSDPPLGPMIGTTITGAVRTLVGGAPMPSLTSFALGLAFKGMFSGVGALASRMRERAVAARFLNHAKVVGDDAFKLALSIDVKRIARTKVGRKLLNDLRKSGKELTIKSSQADQKAAQRFNRYGDHCTRPSGSHARIVPDPEGSHIADIGRGPERVKIVGSGPGAGSEIVYSPERWPSNRHPGSPSDVVLAHELNHARNNAYGKSTAELTDADPTWNDNWTNREEAATVGVENDYRAERGGVPQRVNYRTMP